VIVDLVIWQRIEVVILEPFGSSRAGFFYSQAGVRFLALVPSVAVAPSSDVRALAARDPAQLELCTDGGDGSLVVGVPSLGWPFPGPEILVAFYATLREITASCRS